MKNLLRSIGRIWSTECSSLTSIEHNPHNVGKCNIAVIDRYRFWVKLNPVKTYAVIGKHSYVNEWFFDTGKSTPFHYDNVIREYQGRVNCELRKFEVKAEIKAALSKTNT